MKMRRTYTMTARADSVASTRETIVRSAMHLFFDNYYEDVTLVDIAQAAGVSHQTVLNHFSSKEGVASAVADLLGTETTDARYEAVPGDVGGAVRILVGEYERFGDANARWAASAERLPNLAAILDKARESHRAWLERCFGALLPTGAAGRRRTINALYAATDVYTWKLLRRDLAVSRAETERTIVQLVEGVLDGTTKEPSR